MRMSRMHGAILSASMALSLAAGLSSCAHQKPAAVAPSPLASIEPETAGRLPCETRYPILLVHGYSWKADFPLSGFWGTIPEALEACGAKVYLANYDAFAPIGDRARFLDARVSEVLADSGAGKVNIIAHSTGGLESRYLISSLARGDRVASLTTLATPHRGSRMATYILRQKSLGADHLAGLKNLVSIFLLGDLSPTVLASLQELSPERMEAFNRANPDDPRVRYQSWAAKLDSSYGAVPFLVAWEILRDADGPNDGFVTVESATWGDFRGVVGSELDLPVSHAEIHGLNLFPRANRFDAIAFFRRIVDELKAKGL